MHGNVFAELSLVIALATAISLIMRWLKQPLLVGYILTGILAGPSVLHLIENGPAFESFSEIGIALLLFIIGLELRLSVIKTLGRTVVLTAAATIGGMALVGLVICLAMGFTLPASLLIATALTFSSTIIIVKVFNDRKESSRLYAQIAIGVLLIEDILATFALLFVNSGDSGTTLLAPLASIPALQDTEREIHNFLISTDTLAIFNLTTKGILLALLLWLASSKLLPRVAHHIAKSQELLFLSAIAWGFGVATIFQLAGFSIEIGALFAGIALSSLPYTQEIGARLKPLRDFFIVLFFVVLGERLELHNLLGALGPALILSAAVLIFKPVLVMAALGLMGYTRRTSFKAAVPLSQISEFSIILVVLGANAGIVGNDVAAVITLVAVITIGASAYLLQYDSLLYAKLQGNLQLFERRVIKEHAHRPNTYPLVLFGYKKGGHEFLKAFQSMHKRYVIVDYNPEVIETLERQRHTVLYGDATDTELLDELNLPKIKLAVSTISDHATNQWLIKRLLSHNKEAVFICTAENYNDAAELYRLGATYVMIPHYIGSERISSFIKRNGMSKNQFDRYREKHLLSIGRAAISKDK
ncbi:cation:proton antiporter [Candidatus Saccharibacteria bacterium]|nr:cation:proton antiporter [Candidatus Saccharibacteria bacterium]